MKGQSGSKQVQKHVEDAARQHVHIRSDVDRGAEWERADSSCWHRTPHNTVSQSHHIEDSITHCTITYCKLYTVADTGHLASQYFATQTALYHTTLYFMPKLYNHTMQSSWHYTPRNTVSQSHHIACIPYYTL